MKESLFISKHNISAVNIWSVVESSYDNIYSDMNIYGLLETNRLTKDAKAIIMHHIIIALINFILYQKFHGITVFYCYTNYSCQSVGNHDITNYVLSVFKKIAVLLPIRLLFSQTENFDLYKKKFSCDHSGIYKESITKLLSFIEKYDFSQFTYKKAQTYIKRNNLYYLDKHLFNTLISKQLLLT